MASSRTAKSEPILSSSGIKQASAREARGASEQVGRLTKIWYERFDLFKSAMRIPRELSVETRQCPQHASSPARHSISAAAIISSARAFPTMSVARIPPDRASFRKSKREMDDRTLPLHIAAEPAFLEHLPHRHVVGQDLRNQFLEPGVASNRDEMAHQRSTDASPLVFVDNGKSDFGRSEAAP